MSAEDSPEHWNLSTRRRGRVVSPVSTPSPQRNQNCYKVLDTQSVRTESSNQVSDHSQSTNTPTPYTTSVLVETGKALRPGLQQLRTYPDFIHYYTSVPYPNNDDTSSDGTENTDPITTDDESIYSMGTDTNTGTLGNLLEVMQTQRIDITPITKDMNYAQVVTFREAMGSTLALFPYLEYDSGFSWLVDTTETYQERLGDPDATLPSTPKRPNLPVPDSTTGHSNKTALYTYTRSLRMYKECAHWTNQIISAIETKFPSSLQSKRNRFDGFPLSFNSQDAINHVAESVNKEIPRRQAHCDIQLAVLTKVFKYTFL